MAKPATRDANGVSKDEDLNAFQVSCAQFISELASDHFKLMLLKDICHVKEGKRGINVFFVPMAYLEKPTQWFSNLKLHFMSYNDYHATIASPLLDTPIMLATVKEQIETYNPEENLLWLLASEVGDVLIFTVPING